MQEDDLVDTPALAPALGGIIWQKTTAAVKGPMLECAASQSVTTKALQCLGVRNSLMDM